jgi:hypothetical protein
MIVYYLISASQLLCGEKQDFDTASKESHQRKTSVQKKKG